MEPKTGKRIVSKGEYMRVLCAKMGFNGIGLLLTLTACLPFLVLLYFTVIFLADILTVVFNRSTNISAAGYSIRYVVIALLTSGSVVLILAKLALSSLNKAKHIKIVEPFTCANTADLPAPDSLVRASSKPVQAQQDVLLRAAMEGQQTPPEQLVRASGKQE